MRYDLTSELPLVRLRDLPKLEMIGPRRNGGRLNIRTAYRWAKRGSSGIVLETILQGGVRCTSMAAIRRFFEAVGVARGQKPTGAIAPDQVRREYDPAHVEAQLDRLGI